jgi:hypothetical protein
MIVLDPPREGIHPKAMPKILRFGVDTIVYISCKATSLKNDLAALQAAGYRVKRGCTVDLFPGTVHVETVALLYHQRKISERKHIEMVYEPDDNYLENMNRKVTYSDIKEYVKQKYNMKIHSVQIAKVKVECGLDMQSKRGENDVPVSDDRRRAIMDALKHYHLIA